MIVSVADGAQAHSHMRYYAGTSTESPSRSGGTFGYMHCMPVANIAIGRVTPSVVASEMSLNDEQMIALTWCSGERVGFRVSERTKETSSGIAKSDAYIRSEYGSNI